MQGGSRQQRRQTIILVTLLAVFAVVLLRNWFGETTFQTSQRRSVTDTDLESEMEILKDIEGMADLALIEVRRGEDKEITGLRNLFAFKAPKAETPTPKPIAPAKKQEARQPVVQQDRQPPPITFTCSGKLMIADVPYAAFMTEEEGIMIIKEGEIILPPFRLVAIGYDFVEIGFDNFRTTQRIPIQGEG